MLEVGSKKVSQTSGFDLPK